MSIYQIITQLKSTRSRNEKESILAREANNEDLKTFFCLALNPYINFYQKKPFKQSYGGTYPLSSAMKELESVIAGRVKTGNEAVAFITNIIDSVSVDGGKVIMHILQKESGCDLGGATINKIWPKLIPIYPCLLATAWDDKLASKLDWKSGVFSNLKSDGLRINLVIDETGGVSAFSRAGNTLNFYGAFDFLGEYFKSVVIDGELLTVKANGKFNDRQTSNGIGSKAIKGTMSTVEASSLHITAWDVIPLEDFKNEKSELEYSNRFALLTDMISKIPQFAHKISLIPSRIVYSIDEAQDHFQEMLVAGEEGTVVKSPKMLWENKRSKLQLKLKSEHPGEFEVVGYKLGEGKLTGNLGSLDIASSDRMVLSNLSGYSLKLRSEIFANLTGQDVPYTMVIDDLPVVFFAKPGDCDITIGSIVTVTYNQKIKARDSDTYSLFLPRFSGVRLDKSVANSLSELK